MLESPAQERTGLCPICHTRRLLIDGVIAFHRVAYHRIADYLECPGIGKRPDPDPDPMFGTLLRRLRTSSGLTLDGFTRAAGEGLTVTMLSAIELGYEQPPEPDAIKRWCHEIFDVPPGPLLGAADHDRDRVDFITRRASRNRNLKELLKSGAVFVTLNDEHEARAEYEIQHGCRCGDGLELLPNGAAQPLDTPTGTRACSLCDGRGIHRNAPSFLDWLRLEPYRWKKLLAAYASINEDMNTSNNDPYPFQFTLTQLILFLIGTCLVSMAMAWAANELETVMGFNL